MSEKCKNFRINFTIEEDIKNSELLSFLKTKGKTAFLYDDFNLSVLETEIKTFLHNEKNLKTESREDENGITKITFFSDNSIKEKLNISEKYTLLFYREKNILKFAVVSDNFLKTGTEKSKFNINSVLNNSFRKEITEIIYDHISSQYLKKYPEKKPVTENIFVQKMSLNEHVLISEILETETLLLKLNFKSAEYKANPAEKKDFEKGFIFGGNNSIYLLMLDKNETVTECKKIEEPISVKKNLLKTSVEINNYIIYPKRSEAQTFKYLPEIQNTTDKERIRKTAAFNSELQSFGGAEKLFQLLIDKENNPLDIFLMFLNKYKNSETDFESFISNNDISKILKDVLDIENSEKTLKGIFSDKQLNYEDKIILINLFSELISEPEELNKILPIYTELRKTFLKKNKNLINRAVFDIKFADFLIRCGKNRKAKKILQNLLKHLPDETISDLLPPENLDLTSDKSGQLLRTNILDLYAEAKGKKDEPEEIQKTVLLQPLNINRIDKLTIVKKENLRKRAETAKNILTGKALFADDNPACRTDYKPANEEKLKKYLPHPSVSKKGSLYKIGKWISEIKTDDYNSVKKYSEKISPEAYNTLYAVLKSTAKVFGIENIEFYISKGERNDAVIGYEGNPPFVIIGNRFTDKNSKRYMNLSELQFVVASEIAHIFFKHTKLSSKDVWRGLIEKGSIVADAALATIPLAGFFSKTIKNVSKLNMLTKILQNTAVGITSGKSAYETAIKFSDYLKRKEKPKKEKEKGLIAVSRLMQYTADRAGLLLCGNLASSVKAVLICENFDSDVFEEIKNTSLKDFLLKQNSDGTFKYQKTALRIANLYSFWLSENYEILRKEILP